MTDQFNKLADALENIAHMEYPSGHHDGNNLREAAALLRAAAGVDVAGLMDVADRYALAQADPAHWRSALESSLRLVLAQRVPPGPVIGWAHKDGRVIPAATKETALRDGGASASSVRDYTIALFAASQPQQTQPAEPTSRDADRYRTLRELHWDESDLFVVSGGKSNVKLGTYCPSGDRLDALVDAIRAKKGTSS